MESSNSTHPEVEVDCGLIDVRMDADRVLRGVECVRPVVLEGVLVQDVRQQLVQLRARHASEDGAYHRMPSLT